jgi:hypothetical protein
MEIIEFVAFRWNDNQVLILLAKIFFIKIISLQISLFTGNFFSYLMLLATLNMLSVYALTDQITTLGIKMVKIFVFAMIFNFKTSSYAKECTFIAFYIIFFINLLIWTWWKRTTLFFIFQNLYLTILNVESCTKLRLLKLNTFFFIFLN